MAPTKLGYARALLRRLASSLAELFPADEPRAAVGLLGLYRTATAPANITQLLDLVDELLLERAAHAGHVQQLLREWHDGCPSATQHARLDAECRRLTGVGLDEQLPSAGGNL